jgi:hypothetical protein
VYRFQTVRRHALAQREMDRWLIFVIPINGMKMGFVATSPDSMLGFFAFGRKPKGRAAPTLGRRGLRLSISALTQRSGCFPVAPVHSSPNQTNESLVIDLIKKMLSVNQQIYDPRVDCKNQSKIWVTAR